ncbi:MAG: phenylalanine--tRNA ligase subunit alpha [Candidatus Rokubacteria bacterium RIFCSPHIGHO2_12_FULL_73_22]|nr:MAG: phenylalanine--tRNA ligase subunit alpha [Candidatus Rokubacteria bacterium RIFCSPHIGHO2_12_FULL_73_22]OGL07652.1 MAG: phenylalanine--tRNA ligase subunit alpha [Candidatus Rokubacteria bacterium RIFCSPLOWO2_02_FULL_73_56]OGL25829.1 MAG: phenylalanine--tRNA ligase subunit alpha [Candidatus Rokubacteria bacterium RIFCSPLOWO2_12_FULL_73_47]
MGHPRVDAIAREAREAAAAAASSAELERVRVAYLGRQGLLTQLLRALGTLPPQERPLVGAAANEAKRALEALLDERLAAAQARERRDARARARLDLTLPGRRPPLGVVHPLTRVHDEIVAIFVGLGFAVAEGPEVETDEYNFELLNLPPDHPARDMQDTFYISDAALLRTHTSPVQIRTMKAQRPPVRIICPGAVYRRDADVTHSPMFHQVEGLAVDRRITMGDLKGTLELFAREMFGPRSRIRFRPSFFPFTEPSAEVDVLCFLCAGGGCRVCRQSGWLEILGSGMVHPQVLRNVGYDPEEVTGWAFGMGIERIAMLKYGIDDIRLFFDNDLRFLRQFA